MNGSGTPVATPSNGNTVVVTGNDTAGRITVTAPATGMAAGLQASIAFANAYNGSPLAVTISPGSQASALNAPKFYVPTWAGAVNFGLQTANALEASQVYEWFYKVEGIGQ